MTIPSKPRGTHARRLARDMFIVARGHLALYHALDRAFGGPGGIPVRFDRRLAERRRAVQSVPEERRRGDRRSFPRIEDDLRWRCVLVRPYD
jgi:hypothetical protein